MRIRRTLRMLTNTGTAPIRLAIGPLVHPVTRTSYHRTLIRLGSLVRLFQWPPPMTGPDRTCRMLLMSSVKNLCLI